jgi:glycosyltransferase involved in cell wall biosynthesis
MSHGIAVVATQNDQPNATQAAFTREICGNAALYAPPQDAAQFAAHLHTLLTNPQLAFDLGQEGLKHIQSLSWQAHIQAILRP